jgi:para-nitrobenzyl esterase
MRPLNLALPALTSLALAACGAAEDSGTLAADAVADVGPDPDDADAPSADLGAVDAASPDAAADCGGEAGPLSARTAIGAIGGVADGAGVVFRGVPYAAPPLGARRFEAPAPFSAEEAPGCLPPGFQAADFGLACLQRDAAGAVVGAEDCLTLNVWTPGPLDDTSAARPVMVFLHGGGHIQGSGAETLRGGRLVYDGRRLSDRTGAVVVTLNYRLGPFGYLALGGMDPAVAGNFGLADQLAALRWVQAHIAAFGGDARRVLVFGESAGAVSTCALVASPAARGLFQAALMQSGACVATPRASAVSAGEARVSADTDCPEGEGRLACLRALPAEALLEALAGSINIGASALGAGGGSYGPVASTPLLPEAPLEAIRAGRHNPMPVVVGSNADELAELVTTPVPTPEALERQLRLSMAGVVPEARQEAVLAAYSADRYPSPRDAFVAFLSDARFSCTARATLAALSQGQEAPVWRYWFARRSPLPGGGTKRAVHAVELLYVFGSLKNIPLYTPAADDLALSDAMMALWGAHASGEPLTAPSVAAWPAWTPDEDLSLVLDAAPTVAPRLRAAECEVLEAAVFGGL